MENRVSFNSLSLDVVGIGNAIVDVLIRTEDALKISGKSALI